MPSDDLLKDFMRRTDKSLEEIHRDVRVLQKFRWVVIGGAIASSFIFTIIFEVAKAMAGAR